MNFEAIQAALIGAIQQIFRGAQQLETTRIVTDTKTRAIAARVLFDQVYEALSEINAGARKIDQYGSVYIDWNEYLNCLDVFYEDGALFAVVTRGGKLYRIPITITNDVATLGELVEIPLTAERTAKSSFRVIRTTKPDGTFKYSWMAVACSSVLNRSNEIDSRRLFDSFIAHAETTGIYPILSFYHADDVIRWGVATWLYRNEDLYCAAGDWDETPEAKRAAETFEKDAAEWGTSIGYTSTADPEWLEIAPGITVPVFVEGINQEISIVLEREAAAYLTAFGTQEVLRMKKTDLAYQRLAEKFGEAYADDYLNRVNDAQRAIDESNPVRRAAGDAVADATNIAAANTNTTTAATTETPAPETTAQTRDAAEEFEIPEEMFGALVSAIVESPAFQQVSQGINTANETINGLLPRVEGLETNLTAARTAAETRLTALERDDTQRHADWVADLPQPRSTRVTLRPREARAVELDANGQPAAPDSTVIANSTVDQLNAKRAQQQHA